MALFSPIPLSTVVLAATTVSSRVKLGGQPITGPFQVRFVNPGTTTACVRLRANTEADPTGGSAAVAVTTDIPILPGERGGFTINNTQRSGDWWVAVIMETGTANVEFTSGYGD